MKYRKKYLRSRRNSKLPVEVTIRAHSSQSDRTLETHSSLEKTTSIIGNLSQVGMLCVVIWGYVYTVIPVLQKEKLEEEIVNLEREKISWQSQVASLKDEGIAQKRIVKNIMKNIELLESENSKIKSEIEQERGQLAGISMQLEATKTELGGAEEAFKRRVTDSIPTEFALVVVRDSIFNPPEESASPFPFSEDISEDEIKRRLNESFASPTELHQKAMDFFETKVAESKSTLEKSAYLQAMETYAQNFEEWGRELYCVEPDYDAWVNAFDEAEEASSSQIQPCISELMQTLVQENDWSPKQVAQLNSQGYWQKQEEVLLTSCKDYIKVTFRSGFFSAWSKLRLACTDREHGVGLLLMGEERTRELDPIPDNSPPSLPFLIERLQEVLSRVSFD